MTKEENLKQLTHAMRFGKLDFGILDLSEGVREFRRHKVEIS
jgi:hypothetical protein